MFVFLVENNRNDTHFLFEELQIVYKRVLFLEEGIVAFVIGILIYSTLLRTNEERISTLQRSSYAFEYNIVFIKQIYGNVYLPVKIGTSILLCMRDMN